MNRRAAFLAAFGVMLAAASGCASKTGSVRGRVSYQGKPVAVGTLTLVRDDGWISKPIALDDDGRFAIPAVPIGTVTAVVSVPPANFFAADPQESTDREAIARAAQAKKFIAIPQPYADPKTSGLVYEVRAGENDFNIVLQPGN